MLVFFMDFHYPEYHPKNALWELLYIICIDRLPYNISINIFFLGDPDTSTIIIQSFLHILNYLIIFQPEVNEDDIRKHVFGKPVSEMTFIGLDTSVRRPTVSSARHSVIWARDRKLYEERNKFDVEEFRNQPYMKHEYPSLRKHYPGTWKLATRDQIDETTDRLSHTPAPTAASLHLHKYHSYLYRKLHESDHIPNSSYRRRPKTSVFWI